MTGKQTWTLALAALLACAPLSACGAKESPLPDAATYDTGDDSGWETVEGGEVLMENDRVSFRFDAATTHFTVTDKASGRVYASAPEEGDTVSDEALARLRSEVSLVYYNSDSSRLYMTSAADSVDNENFVVRRQGNALRVTYTMGSENALLLAPQVFTKAFFEDTICGSGALSSSQVRRIERYYDLYTPEDPTEEYAAMREIYPALDTQALYILKDTVDKLKRIEIDGYMQACGYTQEDYQKTLSSLGIEAAQTDEAGFVVPVEYALTADGFTARILMDKVTEQSDRFTLQQIDLLEFFGSAGQEESGYFLVPDGVGALIQFNGEAGSYSQRIYGEEPSKKSATKTQLTQQALLPVFGISYGQSGILAMVENAAQAASINANTLTAANPLNNAFCSLTVREMDVTDIGTDRNIPVFNLYSKNLLRESPQVRYAFLNGDAAGYAGMAAYTRSAMLEDGRLTGQTTDSGLFLDYAGLAAEDASFLGVPYTKKLTLSTLEAIRQDMERLASEGITGVDLRLRGYSGEGITHGVNNAFSIDRRVGDADGLRTLANALSGGRLYLEADFQLVYTDTWFDGYSLRADTAQNLSRGLTALKQYDPVDRAFLNDRFTRYLVSPLLYGGLSASFRQSLDAALPDPSVGLSYASAASLVPGDYSRKRNIDRTGAAAYITDALRDAAKQRPLLSENGNAFTLAYLSRLAGMPLSSSGFDVLSETVPFYPMVVHGSLPYTGGPLNLAADADTAFLRSVEYGAGLSFSLITGSDRMLSGTAYATGFYSMNSAEQLDEVIRRYRELDDVYQATKQAAFIAHERLSDEVTLSGFSNGVQVLVNYGDTTAQIDGAAIPARGFLLRQNPKGGAS